MTPRRFWWSVAAIWGATCLLLIAISWSAITAWRFPDPDDQMRLLEVRDWLNGQSWFDLTQYRLNAPAGVPMHWSRLVDLPIAAVILVARPLLGNAGAEHVALVLVPLLTLGAILAFLALLTRRLTKNDEQALMAICLALVSVEIVHQLRPMRIDHHGWQMAFALMATYGVTEHNGKRAGLLTGIAIALWLSVSLEGLPMVAAILALVALKWAIDPLHRELLRLTTSIAALGTIAIYALSHPLSAWSGSVCDAISPVYLAQLAVAAGGISIVTALPGKTVVGRLGGLALVGVAALAPIPLLAPQCQAGPFGHLDPLVRGFWYLHVMEGLPLWAQAPTTIVNTVAVPLVGLIGTVLAVQQTIGVTRERWISLLFLTACATIAAVLVQRTGSVANLLAVPGLVWLIHPLLQRARAIGNVSKRTLATLGVFLIAAPGVATSATFDALMPGEQPHTAIPAVREAACADPNPMSALGALPRGNVLAPLDISPSILLLTPHSAVASGHHRGAAAMHDVIAAFTGPDALAHQIVTARKIDYVAFCPGLPEIMIYEHAAPAGFLAHIDRGSVPDWLTPIRLSGSPVKVWRVH